MKRCPALLVLAALLSHVAFAQAGTAAPPTATLPAVKPPPEICAPGFATINPEDCKTWLSTLAGDEFEGRKTGQIGHKKAAEFVAKHFASLGLKPVGDKDAEGKPTYFQNVPFVGEQLDVKSAAFEVKAGGKTIAPKLGEGFGASGSGQIDRKANIVFVAAPAKMAAKELKTIDVADKFVIVLPVNESGEIQASGTFSSAMRDLKPAGVIRIDEVKAAQVGGAANVSRKDQSGGGGGRGGANATPAIAISRKVANEIAAAAGIDLAALMTKAGTASAPIVTGKEISAHIVAKSNKADIPVPNVVGYLEGSDPVLKKQLVICGSHLDHLGRSGSGEIFHGADDDGSGSTGLMAVSRAFAKNGTAPKRSMLFIAVCGEEMGLLGSDWYVEHPIFPIEDTVAEFQMDMIGREEEPMAENPRSKPAEQNVNTLKLIGSKRISTELHEIIIKNNTDHVGFEFEYDSEGVYTRSDHYNFARKGIPISFYFSGFHKDYHQVTDTVEKIDFPKLSRVAKLVYLSAFDVANRTPRLIVDHPVKPAKDPKPK